VAKVKEKTMANKKLLLALALMAIVVMGAYAQGFGISAGAGGYFVSDFGGGIKMEAAGQTLVMETPYAGGGGFAFVDITYAELSFGFFGGGMNWNTKLNGNDLGSPQEFSFAGIDIGVMGKFPIAIGSSLTVYPLVGINYRIALSLKDKDSGIEASNVEDLNALWIKFGGGLDYSFTGNMFVRFGLTYGIRLQNQFETDLIDATGSGVTYNLGNGLEARLAVGFAF
jgi:opacity protein-like surface antigen